MDMVKLRRGTQLELNLVYSMEIGHENIHEIFVFVVPEREDAAFFDGKRPFPCNGLGARRVIVIAAGSL
jgi:hypothetical protein